MKTSFKARLQLLIYPRFQLILVFGNSLLLLAILGSAYFSVNQSFNNLIKNGHKAGLDDNHPYFKLLEYQLTHITKNLLISFAVGALLSTLWMLLLSNKLAGPILRLKKYFKNLDPADYKPVNFRKGDFFLELPPLINDAFARIFSTQKND
jgi:hypothetical protein